MALSREEILKQVAGAIDAAEERAAEIEHDAQKKAEAALEDARREAKRIVDRAQAAVAGLAAELTGDVPEAPAPDPEPSPSADPEPGPDPVPGPTPLAHEPPQAAGTNGDEAGARLVAMKMALDGTPREKVAAHLAEAYELSDSDDLLDDVFARAGSR